MKLNYDLVPEELKRKAVNLLVDESQTKEFVRIWDELEKEIKATQQTKKPVDMSVFEGTDVFVEAGDYFIGTDIHQPVIGCLSKSNKRAYLLSNGIKYAICRPLYGHWHSANNFDAYFDLCRKILGAGFIVKNDVENKCFKITGLQENYCMPWEV